MKRILLAMAIISSGAVLHAGLSRSEAKAHCKKRCVGAPKSLIPCEDACIAMLTSGPTCTGKDCPHDVVIT